MAMRTRNGITFFGMGDNYPDHPAFRALQGVSLGDVKFPFGFFLVEEGGNTVVIPGTRDDLIKRLLYVFPDYPVDLITSSGLLCFKYKNRCNGGCPGFPSVYECSQIFDDRDHPLFFSCACVRID